MYTALVIVQVLVAAALIGLILLQHGKGADAGAAFGSGASGTVFGSRGSANFLTRATSWLAAVFFVVSLSLAYLVHGNSGQSSILDSGQPPAVQVKVPEATKPLVPEPLGAQPAPGATPSKSVPKVPD